MGRDTNEQREMKNMGKRKEMWQHLGKTGERYSVGNNETHV